MKVGQRVNIAQPLLEIILPGLGVLPWQLRQFLRNKANLCGQDGVIGVHHALILETCRTECL